MAMTGSGYSAIVIDHFQNPRNVGELADANARASVNNPVCGDVLQLMLKISDGRIAQARFKAKGCVPAMACASALTELVSGSTLEETRKLRRADIIATVGGLPPASTHAAQLAVDALSAALNRIKA